MGLMSVPQSFTHSLQPLHWRCWYGWWSWWSFTLSTATLERVWKSKQEMLWQQRRLVSCLTIGHDGDKACSSNFQLLSDGQVKRLWRGHFCKILKPSGLQKMSSMIHSNIKWHLDITYSKVRCVFPLKTPSIFSCKERLLITFLCIGWVLEMCGYLRLYLLASALENQRECSQ